MKLTLRIGASISVAFRSAKGRSFAERKTTMNTVISSPVRTFLTTLLLAQPAALHADAT